MPATADLTLPLGYTEQLGIRPLREAIARHYERRHSLAVEPNDVVVTTGSSGGFLLSFLAAYDVGDRVALARPGYPAYRNIVPAGGGRRVRRVRGAGHPRRELPDEPRPAWCTA